MLIKINYKFISTVASEQALILVIQNCPLIIFLHLRTLFLKKQQQKKLHTHTHEF